MSLKQLIQEANRTEDGRKVRQALTILRNRHNATYRESREFFQQCDPDITPDRFEELCQLADEQLYPY